MSVLKSTYKKILQLKKTLGDSWNIKLSADDVKRGKYPNIRGTEETLNILLSKRCSMSRLGDGEFVLVFGDSINYQKYSRALADKLIEVLHSNLENHIVCISDAFEDMPERSEENKKYWHEFLKTNRHRCYKYIDFNKIYYNTSATRVYKLLADKSLAKQRFPRWKQLWQDKDVVFIEGEQTRLGVGNDLFSNAKSIKRIIGPSENAFDKWQEILNAALKVDGDPLFILALGPTATVISYELAKQGRYALDLGHIDIEYEWYLRDDSNAKIEGKYTNEVVGGNSVKDCTDDKYLSEVIWNYHDQ